MENDMLTWASLLAGGSRELTLLVLKVLRGFGTPEEAEFVYCKMNKETVLAIALANHDHATD